jgi:hypothetical protein
MTYNGMKLSSISVSDVAMRDYPDFCDAYLEEAYCNELDRWLTEHELERIDGGDINEYIHENIDLYR